MDGHVHVLVESDVPNILSIILQIKDAMPLSV